MIIQTGNRTDIPAFYSEWFANRLQEGYVMVRNPFNLASITKYRLDPSVVDLMAFCTKNPEPMLKYMDLLEPYRQYWFVTITPYGKTVEPNVPEKKMVMDSFKKLSAIVGSDHISWRYDPIFLDEEWTVEKHVETFRHMAEYLNGYTKTAVISFIDLYEKVKRNFSEVKTVPFDTQMIMTEKIVGIAKENGMIVKPCGESKELEKTGADCSGCMSRKAFESAVGQKLVFPTIPRNRKECACFITADIGAYNTCQHFCKYCYANADKKAVMQAVKQHDPSSPLLIGHIRTEDKVHEVKQTSWIDPQMTFESYLSGRNGI